MNKSDHGDGAPSRRRTFVRPEGGPAPFRHLAHVRSFRDNPIVFFTTCTYQRRKILASSRCKKILHDIWQRSADHDGWWMGNYFDRYLRSGENYAEKWHYVERNAVRAGPVEPREVWPYRGTINDLMF
jgi:hypothetical protein